ncbi:GNAT family N-acetyltransferase [Nocardia sp. NPDC059240]|uniref:GNAT family N-acetyltransferase n=1 Tax=Nocardia sp. NPDC059240 TaxID=3346786 RepID=UPI0036818FE6
MTVLVRAADVGDIDSVASVFAAAFDNDPFIGWLLPDSESRLARATRMFAALTAHHLRNGCVDVALDATGTVQGATLWSPPGHWRHTIRAQARLAPALLRAFGPRIPFLVSADYQLQYAHPHEPHWYLQTIGTSPDARGLGHGRALLQSRLTPDSHESSYLETHNPENLPYYERFGFTIRAEFTMHLGGPPAWSMWRPPES